MRLTPRNVKRLSWLPPTCAYRLVAEGRDLYWWHPLVSGDPETVHPAGVSVRGRVAANEKDVPEERLEDFIVSLAGEGAEGGAQARRIVKAKARDGSSTSEKAAGKQERSTLAHTTPASAPIAKPWHTRH